MEKMNQKAIELLEKSQIEENDFSANELIREAIDLLSNKNKSSDKDAFDYYVLGYAWYLLRIESDERCYNVENNFKLSIEKNTENNWPKLYLGHYYFDIGEYENALAFFSSVKGDEFLEFDQVWRLLKLKELIICCKLYLNNMDFCIDEYVSLYEKEDAVNRPEIHELKSCFMVVADSLGKSVREKISNFIYKY